LGVDRLDYTKGIPERLTAFRTLLEHHPELHGTVTMIQVVVSSREDIPEYNQLKRRIEGLVSKINGKHGRPGWMPIHYFYRSISRAELIAYYRTAHVALITPLRDGMNLVAKEFCASRIDNQGILILSEFAGAANELSCGALLVNPHDADMIAAELAAALQMEIHEQRARMQMMRSQIRLNDVFHWAESFVSLPSVSARYPMRKTSCAGVSAFTPL
jgi:trehalose 6-phosphate synthase